MFSYINKAQILQRVRLKMDKCCNLEYTKLTIIKCYILLCIMYYNLLSTRKYLWQYIHFRVRTSDNRLKIEMKYSSQY